MELLGVLDTNVVVRYAMQDHPEHSEAAIQFFDALSRGEFSVRLLDTVVFESAYTLGSVFVVPRSQVAEILIRILALPGIILPGKEMYAEVFELWTTTRRLSFADAYHLVSTRELGFDTIISFDRGLRGFPGVTRLEPPLS